MMKVLLLNGSPNEKGCTFTALAEIAKELEKENARLKKLVAEQALDISILRDVNSKNF